MPENEEQAELYRNPHSGFLAYVPKGSLTKGKDLVTTGGARIVGKEFIRGKTTPCITCHGPDLMGVADIPQLPDARQVTWFGRCGICSKEPETARLRS
jgi:cytochrome c553